MVKKVTVVMMLVLLAQPFCCCLFAMEEAGQNMAEMPCCESSETPMQDAVPMHNDTDPCDCDSHEAVVMITPENASSGAIVWKLDFIVDQPALQETVLYPRGEVLVSGSYGSLSAFHPPGWRSCQEYCVYRL